MRTPVADFVRQYAASDFARLHMPGHKGRAFLGCEALDITEINGADSLYEACGILDESENNASRLFGSGRTLFSTEGSSQCIRAMLYLSLSNHPTGSRPTIVAARNVHKAFVFAAALLDFDVVWLWPDSKNRSLCSCEISPQTLEHTLCAMDPPPAAVYVTSPDYLGQQADIAALATVCHRHHTLLLVDNAHGAYLRFLSPSQHPLDLGADCCCDSAHKTLPVLTGGAYLHIGKQAPAHFVQQAKAALALFGSTSPSYLTLASLDLCNAYLDAGYPHRLLETVNRIKNVRKSLTIAGYSLLPSDPLKLTLDAAACGSSGNDLANRLRRHKIECEYADTDHLVMMATPETTDDDLLRLIHALGVNQKAPRPSAPLPRLEGIRVLSIRDSLFAPQETLPVRAALDRICGAPTVACPPAIPIVVSGERITSEAIAIFERYGISKVSVVRQTAASSQN